MQNGVVEQKEIMRFFYYFVLCIAILFGTHGKPQRSGRKSTNTYLFSASSLESLPHKLTLARARGRERRCKRVRILVCSCSVAM